MPWSNTGGGVVTASEVIITTAPNSGLLIYSGTAPANGNLVGSISPAGGTDPYGNTYPAGYFFTNGTLEFLATVETYLGSLIPDIRLVTGSATESVNFHIGAASTGSAGNAGLIAEIVGPATNVNNDACFIELQSGTNNGTGDASLSLTYAGNVITGTHQAEGLFLGSGGMELFGVQSLNAVKPGTGTSNTNPFQIESWNALSGLYVNGWSDFGSPYQTGRYQQEPGGGGRTWLDGMIKPGTYVNNTTLFTLPSAYAPLARHRFVMQADSATTGANMFELEIQTSGAMVLTSIQGAAPGFIDLTQINWPLD